VDATYVSRSEKMPSGKVDERSSAIMYVVFVRTVLEKERGRRLVGWREL